MKKLLTVLGVVILIMGLVFACSPAPSAAPATQSAQPVQAQPTKQPVKVNLNASTVASSSGMYAYCVGLAKAANKSEAVNNTAIEGSGTVDQLSKLREGTFDWVTGATFNDAFQLYTGIENFKDKPWPETRLLFLREISHHQIYVTKESGVKSFSDLAGKRFNPGAPGASSSLLFNNVVKLFGINIDTWMASFADAQKAIQDGKIVGMVKASPADLFDSSMLEVNITKPLTLVGYTEEQAKAIMKAFPTSSLILYPVGKNKVAPEAGGFYVSVVVGGSVGSTRLSEDLVYSMTKAVYENWQEVAAVYPPCGNYDTIKDIVSYLPQGMAVPLHAGMVRYAREKGIDIPSYLIPPEYKGK